jgi:biotin transport system substrate-specific component
MRLTFRAARPGRALTVTPESRGISALAVRPLLLKATLVTAGVGVLAASAWISVPFYPVPMTMQTLAVLLVGGLLGPRLGVAAVVGYLALGFTGAPVFHGGVGGAAVVAGPTGGYLTGFVPAAFLMGLATRSAAGRRGMLRRAAIVVVGALSAEVAIYTLGLPWLAFVTGLDVRDTVAGGLIPFVLGDLVKTVTAVVVLCGGRRLLSRWSLLPF